VAPASLMPSRQQAASQDETRLCWQRLSHPRAHQMTTMSQGASCGPCLSGVEQAAASTAQQELVAAGWSMEITLASPYRRLTR
jgi:hypothetical protein